MMAEDCAEIAAFHRVSLEGAKVCTAAHLAASQARDNAMEPISQALREAYTPGSNVDQAAREALLKAMWTVEQRYDRAAQKADKAYAALMAEAHKQLIGQ